MSRYIKDGQAYRFNEVRAAHPNVSIPRNADLSHLGYATIQDTTQPTLAAGEVASLGDPEQLPDGSWRETWVIENPVPQTVRSLQALLAIDALGYTSLYESWVDSADRTFREKAFTSKAQTWHRDDETFNAAADALSFTEQDKDDFFRLAATL